MCSVNACGSIVACYDLTTFFSIKHKMSKALFDDDSDSGGELQLGTNKEYAKSYNTFRQKELLKKRKFIAYHMCVFIT